MMDRWCLGDKPSSLLVGCKPLSCQRSDSQPVGVTKMVESVQHTVLCISNLSSKMLSSKQQPSQGGWVRD